MPRGGSKPGERRGGRRPGSRNKRTRDGETYARAIVEDPTVMATMLARAQDGTLNPDVLKVLLSYAFGRPVDVRTDGDDGSEPRSITITF
jgi:hypothetical protein